MRSLYTFKQYSHYLTSISKGIFLCIIWIFVRGGSNEMVQNVQKTKQVEIRMCRIGITLWDIEGRDWSVRRKTQNRSDYTKYPIAFLCTLIAVGRGLWPGVKHFWTENVLSNSGNIYQQHLSFLCPALIKNSYVGLNTQSFRSNIKEFYTYTLQY